MASMMVGDMCMYYAEAGNHDGAPLILLHGFNGTGAAWEPQCDALGTHYRLILPDLRGHGRTDNPAGIAAMNHRQFARDIVGLCEALDIRRAAFCGESTGSMLQLSLALFAPDLVAAGILAAATYYFPDTARAMFRQLTPDTLPQHVRTRLEAIHVALGPEHWRTVVEANHNLHTHTHAEDFPEPNELPRITAPVLIVHGDRDPALPLDIPTSLYQMLPNAELCAPQYGTQSTGRAACMLQCHCTRLSGPSLHHNHIRGIRYEAGQYAIRSNACDEEQLLETAA